MCTVTGVIGNLEVNLPVYQTPPTVNYKWANTPNITSISPNIFNPLGGVTLTILGSNFSTIANENVITVDGQNWTVTSASAT